MKNRRKMDDLALEITELTEKIEEAKIKNKKKRLHCNMEKIVALSKLGAAFTIVPLSGTLLTCAFWWNPFKLSDEKIPKVITTTIDRDGNESNEELYTYDDESYLTLSYYTKWEETKNGNYIRKKYEYNLEVDSDIQNLISLMKSGEDISRDRIEELINEKIHSRGSFGRKYLELSDEYKAILDYDLENKDYIEINGKLIDKSDFIIGKESMNDHALGLSMKIVIEIFIMIFEFVILHDSTYFFEHQKSKLHSRPDLINIRKLQRELDEKQRIFNEYQYESLEYDDEDVVIISEKNLEEPVQFKKQRLQ